MHAWQKRTLSHFSSQSRCLRIALAVLEQSLTLMGGWFVQSRDEALHLHEIRILLLNQHPLLSVFYLGRVSLGGHILLFERTQNIGRRQDRRFFDVLLARIHILRWVLHQITHGSSVKLESSGLWLVVDLIHKPGQVGNPSCSNAPSFAVSR